MVSPLVVRSVDALSGLRSIGVAVIVEEPAISKVGKDYSDNPDGLRDSLADRAGLYGC